MTKLFAVANVKPVTRFSQSFFDLAFQKKRGLKKTMRKRANACVNILKQCGWLKPKAIEHVDYQTIRIDGDRLERWILENHRELITRFNVRQSVILMGAKEFEDLTDVFLQSPMRFAMSDLGSRRLYGMMIAVLPWMSGTVLVPKEYLPLDEKTVVEKVP